MMYCLVNKIQTPDGTILHCKHRRDYQSHVDSITKEQYINDGGEYYVRRSINQHPPLDLSVWIDSSKPQLTDQVRQAKFWGSYGKDGKQPKFYLALSEMETEHITAILQTQSQIKNTVIEELFKLELNQRKQNV